jgi:hypothetical protein
MRQRRRFDEIINALIAEARADPAIGERSDVLALLLQGLPVFLRPFGRLFAGAPDTLMYRELQRGRLSYRMHHFIKD